MEDGGLRRLFGCPFCNDEAKNLSISQVKGLKENTVLFLDRIKSLSLDTGDAQRMVVLRNTRSKMLSKVKELRFPSIHRRKVSQRRGHWEKVSPR